MRNFMKLDLYASWLALALIIEPQRNANSMLEIVNTGRAQANILALVGTAGGMHRAQQPPGCYNVMVGLHIKQ